MLKQRHVQMFTKTRRQKKGKFIFFSGYSRNSQPSISIAFNKMVFYFHLTCVWIFLPDLNVWNQLHDGQNYSLCLWLVVRVPSRLKTAEQTPQTSVWWDTMRTPLLGCEDEGHTEWKCEDLCVHFLPFSLPGRSLPLPALLCALGNWLCCRLWPLLVVWCLGQQGAVVRKGRDEKGLGVSIGGSLPKRSHWAVSLDLGHCSSQPVSAGLLGDNQGPSD